MCIAHAGTHKKPYVWDAKQGRLRAVDLQDLSHGEDYGRTVQVGREWGVRHWWTSMVTYFLLVRWAHSKGRLDGSCAYGDPLSRAMVHHAWT